ncbi:MAG: ABC transporter ATP-binding protein, partial [Candidatus Izemoplasmatales bacterium]|nr:ABC transporter ATP-binding protein [Candidatus Izemoplasmatales bacterium]
MLKLVNINKEYRVGDTITKALIDINLEFRTNEFVSVFGQSGCGKTTLLNLIGGLDKYTSGDLFINNQSTKEFKDGDWDSYRNSTIGFVFQSYNLIAHLSVLDNVEIALTLSGVPAAQRIARAKQVLIDVGLKDQMFKRPNQLSGGQAQRVAIARALVNDPKIVLADEPTGAIDSKTSIQIMELIKKISKDRLVIMVTHNEELANTYSDRIIRLLDGQVVEDSEPYTNRTETIKVEVKPKKTSMSYRTALKSSFKNLISKKARTIITAIAGSIGIIGIALVLAISNGMTTYVSEMQSDTLAGFPLSINQTVSASQVMLSGSQTRISDITGSLIDINDFPTDETIVAYDSSINTNT